MLQPARAAWRTQFTIGALLFALLPVLNALTTEAHRGVTLARGNCVYAGFDLTMLGLGALLALAAMHAARAPKKLEKSRKNTAEDSLIVPPPMEQA